LSAAVQEVLGVTALARVARVGTELTDVLVVVGEAEAGVAGLEGVVVGDVVVGEVVVGEAVVGDVVVGDPVVGGGVVVGDVVGGGGSVVGGGGLELLLQMLSAPRRSTAAVCRSMSAVCWALTTACWACFRLAGPLGRTAAVRMARAPSATNDAVCAEPLPLLPVFPAAWPASFSANTA
jgi:hypothetical protein